MELLTRNEILKLCEKYNEEEDQWNAKLESNLGRKFREKEELTKNDLKEVINWKFATNQHRLKRSMNLIRDLKDIDIRRLSREAFRSKDDKSKIEHLMEIRGVGPAIASSILTFLNPERFCIFDIHIYDEIFGTNSKTRPNFKASHYLNLLEKMREIANLNGVNTRDVEKAYFKKNLDGETLPE